MTIEKLKYMPSEDELKAAENMMSPEERKASEIRARFKFQEHDPFDDFLEQIDQNDERRPPTAEEKEKMDARLIKLGKIFENSGARWCLDGALNISLMKGEYIGIHKDVDMSVEKADLEKIDAHLEKSGYGLFLSYVKNPEEPRGKKILERVGAKNFSESELEHLLIVAIDENGQVKEGEDLNFIDIHLVKRNADGKPTGRADVELPEKWFEPQVIEYKGQKINISNPSKVAYYKLHGMRSYDRTDLRELAQTGELTLEDVNEIEEVLGRETIARRSQAEMLLGKIADKLKPQMSAEEIYKVFIGEPEIAEVEEVFGEQLKQLTKKIEASDRTKSEMIRLAFETFKMEGSVHEQKKKIAELLQWVSDTLKLKEVRDNLR